MISRRTFLALAGSVPAASLPAMEQEGSRYPELDTAQRRLATWRAMRG